MEIQALTLLVTEQDLNEIARRRLPQDEEVRKVRIRLTPEGVQVNGVYQMMFGVSFETFWSLEVDNGKLLARLGRFKALGVPLTLLKSMIMSTVQEAVGRHDFIHVNEDTIHLNLDDLLSRHGVPLATNLSRVHCGEGQLLIVAGTPAAVVGGP